MTSTYHLRRRRHGGHGEAVRDHNIAVKSGGPVWRNIVAIRASRSVGRVGVVGASQSLAGVFCDIVGVGNPSRAAINKVAAGVGQNIKRNSFGDLLGTVNIASSV